MKIRFTKRGFRLTSTKPGDVLAQPEVDEADRASLAAHRALWTAYWSPGRLAIARVALAKARATMDCGSGCTWSFMKNCDGTFHHADIASALLNGFSVDEITAVGG